MPVRDQPLFCARAWPRDRAEHKGPSRREVVALGLNVSRLRIASGVTGVLHAVGFYGPLKLRVAGATLNYLVLAAMSVCALVHRFIA
jgi:hypothetical protein